MVAAPLRLPLARLFFHFLFFIHSIYFILFLTLPHDYYYSDYHDFHFTTLYLTRNIIIFHHHHHCRLHDVYHCRNCFQPFSPLCIASPSIHHILLLPVPFFPPLFLSFVTFLSIMYFSSTQTAILKREHYAFVDDVVSVLPSSPSPTATTITAFLIMVHLASHFNFVDYSKVFFCFVSSTTTK